MKTHQKILWGTICVMALAASCKKTAPNSPITLTSNMSASIDGKSWTSSSIVGSNQSGQLVFIGTQPDGQTIQLNIALTKAGVYQIKQGSGNSASYKPDNSINLNFYAAGFDPAGVGEINVTSLDADKQTASGTFSFVGVYQKDPNNKNISGGTFTNLPFYDVTQYGKLSATVDGKSWTGKYATAKVSGGSLNIASYSADGTFIMFDIPSGINVGSYQLKSSNNYLGSYQTSAGNFQSASGTLNITFKSTYVISGTFQFSGVDSKNSSNKVTVSGGSFTAQFK